MSVLVINSNGSSDPFWHQFETASQRLHAASALLGLEDDDLTSLTPTERAAYLLGHLLLQVRNGGWEQWVTNDYAVWLRETREVAAAMQTKLSRRVVRMLDKLEPLIDLTAVGGGCAFIMTDAQQEDNLWDRPVITAGERLCEKLDDRFDEIDAVWEAEIDLWLRSGAPGLR